MATTKKETGTTTPKTTTTSTKKVASDLEKELATLRAQIDMLIKEKEAVTTTAPIKEESKKDEYIHPNKKIKVISLTYGTLTLWCSTRGMTSFKGFGDTAVMTYSQLFDYMNTCRNAAKNGYFFIADPEVVEEFGLTEDYKKILSYDKILEVINGSDIDTKALELFSGIPEPLKESITNYVADLVYNKSLTDLNKIDIISNRLGVNIIQKVEEMKTIQTREA